jgi:carboxypeptidase Taq
LEVQNDSEGVMQDTHWPSGYFGYFPSYALGNIYSGQFLDKIKHEIPNMRTQIAEGNVKNITKWLAENVHAQGNLYDPADLIKKITRSQLDAKPYIAYLRDKYGTLYGF